MRVTGLIVLMMAVAALAGCTPDHVLKTSEDLAVQTGVSDSVAISRTNDRLFTRQARICLVGNYTNAEAAQTLLRNIQAGMSGYFLAVGVEGQSLDFATATQKIPCPGANYLWYVQVIGNPCEDGSPSCSDPNIKDLLITVVNGDNSGIADRITVSLQRSWLTLAADAQAEQRAAFEHLARTLTGANTP